MAEQLSERPSSVFSFVLLCFFFLSGLCCSTPISLRVCLSSVFFHFCVWLIPMICCLGGNQDDNETSGKGCMVGVGYV